MNSEQKSCITCANYGPARVANPGLVYCYIDLSERDKELIHNFGRSDLLQKAVAVSPNIAGRCDNYQRASERTIEIRTANRTQKPEVLAA